MTDDMTLDDRDHMTDDMTLDDRDHMTDDMTLDHRDHMTDDMTLDHRDHMTDDMTLYAASTTKIPAYLLMYKGAALKKIWGGGKSQKSKFGKAHIFGLASWREKSQHIYRLYEVAALKKNWKGE